MLVDTNLQLLLVNPTARRLFAWENKPIIGENLLENLPPEITAQLTQPLRELAADQGSLLFSPGHGPQEEEQDKTYAPEEFRISLTQPFPRTIRLMLTQVLDQNRENLRGIVMTVQDITREVELNEAKSQFISNVSHELRTPLFNIKSFIETLSEFGEDLSEVERKEFLETANHETDRLSRLVNDVLDLSKLESSKIYQLDAVDLYQLIEQSLRSYQLNAKDKQLQLEKILDPDLPFALGNYDLLLQVMTNLIGNSFKFTKAGGKIIVRAYPLHRSNLRAEDGPGLVRVEISDTGIGIDPEDQAAIFERFYRVENRVHTLEGTGLGLSIVKNIIAKHQSQIHLVSEVGVGTTFWFDLAVYQSMLMVVG
jgi:two-component system sensor histidine kinase NblS